MTKYSKRFRLVATVALAAIALSTAPVMSGPGKSGDHGGGNGNGGKGNGYGKSSTEAKLLRAGKQDHGNHRNNNGGGTLASELKKLNGAIHASFKAWTNASPKGVPGLARTYAESREALSTYDGDILALQTEASLLDGTLTLEEYNTRIDDRIGALDPADFDTTDAYDAEVTRLTDLKYSELPDGPDTIARLEQINTDLTAYDGYATSAGDSLNSLTGGRELSDEAMGAFETRVDDYLASDEYLASVETDPALDEEEPPVE